MDRTLRSFLQQADETHNYLEKYCIALSKEQLEKKITELQSAIKTIQAVAYQIANVSNIATKLAEKKRITIETAIDPYPTITDIGTLRAKYPEESEEIMTNITIPVKHIETSSEMPVNDLYYIRDIKQYAINIGGILIRGNLSNLVDYKTEQSAECEYGINCKSFAKNTVCPYYHDPTDFVHHNLPVPDITRNFTIGSWIYSKKKTPKTYFNRHIGSKDRLHYDLSTLKRVQYREEIYNREGQLIHDLLIYLILNNKGLLKRYPHWKNI